MHNLRASLQWFLEGFGTSLGQLVLPLKSSTKGWFFCGILGVNCKWNQHFFSCAKICVVRFVRKPYKPSQHLFFFDFLLGRVGINCLGSWTRHCCILQKFIGFHWLLIVLSTQFETDQKKSLFAINVWYLNFFKLNLLYENYLG